jgi:hypothetical protein
VWWVWECEIPVRRHPQVTVKHCAPALCLVRKACSQCWTFACAYYLTNVPDSHKAKLCHSVSEISTTIALPLHATMPAKLAPCSSLTRPILNTADMLCRLLCRSVLQLDH